MPRTLKRTYCITVHDPDVYAEDTQFRDLTKGEYASVLEARLEILTQLHPLKLIEAEVPEDAKNANVPVVAMYTPSEHLGCVVCIKIAADPEWD